MDSSNLLAPPPYTAPAAFSSYRMLNPSSLAPSNFATQSYQPTEEEIEVLRVGLFVDILNYEFRQHKGFASSNWKSLFKYWKKHISQGYFWSSRNEVKKINVHRLVKEGVLTVETQKRLYGEDPWFPENIEDERDKTIEWMKSLEPEDVEYTLYAFYDGGLKDIREAINRKKRPVSQGNYSRTRKEQPVIITDPYILEVVLKIFKEIKGFHSKDISQLSKFAIKLKENPKLDIEFLRKARNNKISLAPTNLSPPMQDQNYKELFLSYDEEDFEASFRQYFDNLASQKFTTGFRGTSANREKMKKITYVKLQQNCYRALCIPIKYSFVILDFDDISSLVPHMRPMLVYLQKFYEERKNMFGFNEEEFINHCLVNRFPTMAFQISEEDEEMYASSLFDVPREKLKKQKKQEVKKVENKIEPMTEGEVRMHVNHFSTNKMIFIRLYIVFSEYHGYPPHEGHVLCTFWNKIHPQDKNKLSLWIFPQPKPQPITLSKPEKDLIEKEENRKSAEIQKFFDDLQKMKEDKEKEIASKKEITAKKLKEKYANPKRVVLHESKQARWALGKKLLEIEKKFPMDPIIRSMVKTEFSENRLKKYDLEYETNNEEDELKRKLGKIANEPPLQTGAKLSSEERMKLESNKLRIMEEHGQKTEEQIRDSKIKEQEPGMFKAIKMLVKSYINFKKQGGGSVSSYLNSGYVSLKTQFPLAVHKHFPYKNYGATRKPDGQLTFSKSFPISFKHYFFAAFKSLLKTPKGLMILKSMPALIWAPPSKNRCTIHYDVCPPDCMYVTLNKKVTRQMLKSEGYTVAWHAKLRPFFRPDMEGQKQKIFMSYSDARECRFEPIVGSKAPEKHLNLTFQHFSEIRNKLNPNDPPNFNMWVNRLGENLRSAEPSLFKHGILKQANVLLAHGKFKDCKTLLVENFNMPYILDHFEPGKNRPNINEKPAEDFNKPENKEMNTEVYMIYKALKVRYQQRKKEEKSLVNLRLADKTKTAERFKATMCPKLKCEKIKCPYSHEFNEHRLAKEKIKAEWEKIKEQMMMSKKSKTFSAGITK
ncbi:hypothetical protein SteCoe_8120 [Stentor coeruleus]|uniref:Uncharacterized protein n=1 Tax=Stentor coeruleus TaxID=5963 RepID=A0A1R2CKX1_9CILI|nr:hypothetical protein SteCoe_8120 [Stentor coeruleus]